MNVDHAYLAANNLTKPATFEDLTKPEYKDLLVVQSPATSSPGLAFLLGTIAHFGEDGWQDYWTSLKDNGVKVTAGWTDAYTVDFSGSSGKGDRPLVVSYASSPPAEIAEGATEAPTAALLGHLLPAGRVRRSAHRGRRTRPARNGLSTSCCLPRSSGPWRRTCTSTRSTRASRCPPTWEQFAPTAAKPAGLDPATIADKRDEWITAWSDLMEG